MLFFRNDYGQGCIEEILSLLKEINYENITGYGMDPYCNKAKQLIKKQIPDLDVDVHFLAGGTIANQTIIKHILKPYEAVIACDTGHVSTHETGSIEATGHKVITLENNNGKLIPEMIKQCFDAHMLSYEHMVYPKLVYISNATEFGTVYFFFKKQDNVWAKKEFRDALLEAIPYDKLREKFNIKAETFIYPLPGYPEVAGISDYDENDALKMMNEARQKNGIPQEEKLPLIFAATGDGYLSECANILKNAWRMRQALCKVRPLPQTRTIRAIAFD